MPIEKLKKEIGLIKYPNLEKTLDDFSLVHAVSIENETCLKVVLRTSSNEVFNELAKEIRNKYKESFNDISVFRESTEQKQNATYVSAQKTKAQQSFSVKQVIAVASGKGGVGKSMVSVNLAVALTEEGFSVGLLDVDAHGSSIARVSGIEQENVSWDEHGKMIPHEKYGVKIISVGNVVTESDGPLVWKKTNVESTLLQLLEGVAWGELDFLVIDIPSGTNDIQYNIVERLPISVALMVTTPQHACVDAVSHTMKIFQELNIKIAGIVENMSYFQTLDTGTRYDIFGDSKVDTLAQDFETNVLGKIPFSMEICKQNDEGIVCVAKGSNEVKKHYRTLTTNLLKNIL